MQRERNFNETKSFCSKIVVTEFVAEATSPVKEWHDLRQKQNNPKCCIVSAGHPTSTHIGSIVVEPC